MALTAAGIGSGLDVESILQQLGDIERRPINDLNSKRQALDVRLSAFGQVKSALSGFQSAVDTLSSNADFGGFVTESSDEGVATGTASSSADSAVDVDVIVNKVATHHVLSSGSYASSDTAVERGTLTFTVGDDSFDVVIDENNDTLDGLRSAINSHLDNTSVSASIVNVDGGSRLILTAKESGIDGKISVTRDSVLPLGNNSAGFDEVTEAVNASLIVHGFPVTRSSNTISDVIPGVTLELKGEGTTTIKSDRDLTTLKTALDEFVMMFNTMSGTIADLGSGELQGDQLPRGLDQRLRDAFFTGVQLGNDDSATALDMGFSFDKDGVLSLNSTKYEAALEDGVSRFIDIFSKSETGLASLFSGIIDEYTDTGGIISTREDGIDSRKSSLDDQIERLEYRVEITNERLRKQFTAMDLAVSSLQNTSSFLASRLGNTNS